MDPPAGYRLRAATPADLAAVSEVFRVDELARGVQGMLEAGFLRDEWSREGFELATDAWVAVDGADLVVGYAQVVREDPDVVEAWGLVHPGHRGRGVGSALMDRAEARASEMAGERPVRFRQAINAADREAALMLGARRFRPVRRFWHMVIELPEVLEAGPAPAGIRIGGVDPREDLAAAHSVLSEAFAEDWGYHPEPLDRWAASELGSPSADPTLWLLAREAGEPVGALTAAALGDRGWVNELGVLPTHRARGIGAALLRTSFARFAARGLRRAMLNVDSENPTRATALYERVGMRVADRWDLWEASGSPGQ